MENLQRKYDILKFRLTQLIEEHADALALAQDYSAKYKEATETIELLQRKLEENVQEEKERTVKDKTKLS